MKLSTTWLTVVLGTFLSVCVAGCTTESRQNRNAYIAPTWRIFEARTPNSDNPFIHFVLLEAGGKSGDCPPTGIIVYDKDGNEWHYRALTGSADRWQLILYSQDGNQMNVPITEILHTNSNPYPKLRSRGSWPSRVESKK